MCRSLVILDSIKFVTCKVFYYGGKDVNNYTFVEEKSQYRIRWIDRMSDISKGGYTGLNIMWNGTFKDQRYTKEIIRPHVVPYVVATEMVSF